MLAARTFRVIFVAEGRGAGIGPGAQPDRIVEYRGDAVTVKP